MLNFNKDRRQSCVNFKCEPYKDKWKDNWNKYYGNGN